MGQIGEAFEELVRVIAKLRDPHGGCPWDLKQTHQTLKPYLIEEAFEAVDAVDTSPSALADELGDVLLQVVLHAQVAADARTFDVTTIVKGLTEKMIRRHPHVFVKDSAAAAQVKSAEDVLKNWEAIKAEERKEPASKKGQSLLDGIPKSLPALARAHTLGERAQRIGFDWNSSADVTAKVREELAEFLEALQQDPSSTHTREEFGDLLFVLAQLGRKLGINPEHALTNGNKKFERRFKAMENLNSGPLNGRSSSELEGLWQTVKKSER